MINTNRIISSTTIVVALIAILMIVYSNSIGSGQFFTFSQIVYGQSSTNTTLGNTSNSSAKLPVLLIHGYMEDATVWNK